MTNRQADIEAGALNLLKNCAGTKTGDRLLVIHEPPALDYYDQGMVEMVADCGRAMGADVRVLEAPFDPDASRLPDDLEVEMKSADQTVFLARIGDQIRFSDIGRHHQVVVSYALSRALLGCRFGTADYDSFVALKDAIDAMLANSSSVEVTCPSGTRFSGSAPADHASSEDVSIRRFPMLVFTPVPADDFSGKAAMPGFLVGTGSKYYEPLLKAFDGQLLAHFEAGRITGFEGSAEDVRRAEDHYRFVAERYGIDSGFVHSWHAGMHPGCHYDKRLDDDPGRWSGSAFGNPRILHFHTCGAYAPGEISWNIIDPTVSIDGVKVWENGTLFPERIPGGRALMDADPSIRAAFEHPSREIGL